MSIYLDIETEWNGSITVVGFFHETTGLVQLYGEDVTRDRFLDELPEDASRIFTYNGHSFDMPCIHNQLAVDLRMRYRSHDLRWICQRNGIVGGLKGVERKVGITRRLEDRGGGLARVNGRVRLVEGLAMPREEVEFELSYYNSNTCWIDLDKLLAAFGLTRADLGSEEKVAAAIRHLAAKMPTYITLKDVKKRWGHGQEDIFPVTQFEKLWVDMTALPEIESRFVVVPRLRGQQLKDQAQLDGWLRDGSAAYVESLCEFQSVRT